MTAARTWAPWVVIAAVVLGVLGYAQTASGESTLTSLGLKPKPDRYTALAFANVDALPYSVVTGDTVTMPVTVENHQGRAVDYMVTVKGAGSTDTSGRGQVIVPDGSTRVINLTVRLRCAVPKGRQTADSLPTARVVVAVAPSGESITHTMYCRPQP